MRGKIYITGNIGDFGDGEDFTDLISVISQVKKQPNATSFEVIVSSPGGYIYDGEAIINYLCDLTVPLIAIGYGVIASMATVIFLSIENRYLKPGVSFMIHEPEGGGTGRAGDIYEAAKEVEALRKEFVDFYSTSIGIGEKAADYLMEVETWLTYEQCIEIGIAKPYESATMIRRK